MVIIYKKTDNVQKAVTEATKNLQKPISNPATRRAKLAEQNVLFRGTNKGTACYFEGDNVELDKQLNK